jgi:hypothetical protein
VATVPVRVDEETHKSLVRLRLRTGAEIGRNITMGEIVSILIVVGLKYYPEIVTEAESRE